MTTAGFVTASSPQLFRDEQGFRDVMTGPAPTSRIA
jgi:hypothetical protein